MTRFSRLIESIGQQRDKVIEYQTRMTELPALGPENAGTGEMPKALYLEGLLRELGVTDILRIDAPDPRVPDGVRPNVVARIPGASPRRLWILGHMDVVPPGELSYWKTIRGRLSSTATRSVAVAWRTISRPSFAACSLHRN